MSTSYPFRSALITGASSGIGEAMVQLLGEAGTPQVIVARRGERLDELAARYKGVEVLAADLTTAEGVDSVVGRITDPEHPIDLVVNNAGFGTSGDFHLLDSERMSAEIALNVLALTLISRAALGVMVPSGRGYLLNVSSVAGFQPARKLAVYAATKAYVTSLSESLHEEVRGTGVHVTALCPGLTRTEFQSVSRTEAYTMQIPSMAWMSATEVAAAGLHDVARGNALSIPGAINKVLAAASGVAPRALARRISSLVQRN